MKYAVIYESATGNTEMLAKEIKSTLGEEKMRLLRYTGRRTAE